MFRPRSILLYALLALLWLRPLDAAPENTGTRLLRQPTVSANQIAFAYANNIWIVPRAGGMARRVTSFQGTTVNPKFSPDGASIAFSAEYGGNLDVYVVRAEGGEPRRLTWHPGADTVQGWSPDGKSILFTSSRATWAPSGAARFFLVPESGGVEEPMALPRGYQGKISADGRRIAYRMNSSWDEERRNYRGGQNRPVWVVDLKTYDLVSPPWTDSKDTDPVWVGDQVYFISDRDGVANVWAFETGNKRLRQVTKFSDFDVKAVDAGGGAVVFEQGGYIHELEPGSGRTKVVNITATGDFPWMMPRWEDVSARISNIAISPTGKRAVVEARGEIFTIPTDKGDVRNLTRTSGVAERNPVWSPDGKYVSYFSDRSGEYRLVIEEQDGLAPPREITLQKPTHYYTPSWSPDSKKLLYTDTNLKVWVLDVATGQAKVVGNDPWMVPERTLNPVWSPDSKFVAYSSRLRSMYHAIFVANVDTGESKQVTDTLADAIWPAWDASGKYLWFLASTDFGLGSQWLDMTSYPYNETFGLYFAILKKGEPTPLLPESDEDTGVQSSRPGPGGAPGGGRGGRGGGGGDATEEQPPSQSNEPPRAPQRPVTVVIDFDDIHRRIVAVPGVPVRQYSQLRAGLAGTVYYLEAAAGAGGGGSTLHRYRLADRRAAPFVNGVADYDVSADGRKLLYRSGGGGGGRGGRGGAPAGGGPGLFVVDADRTPPQANAGRLDVQLRMYLEPKEEFKQIFKEGWRNQRDYLYVPNLHGANWTKMEEMYGQILPHVMHRADLNYLLDNMGAEIAVGHSYVRGGAMPDVPTAGGGGLLGADFAIENGRYKITRIYDNESWNPELRAPLHMPGVDVSVGEYLIAINGEELKAPDNIYRLLDGTANRQTVLTVNGKPVPDGARRVTVIPLASEQGLRYSRVGRAQSPARGQTLGRSAGLRLSAQHGTGRVSELQSLLLRPAGQGWRRGGRAVQRRRIGGRLHHRRPAARLRRLLQQRRGRSVSVHESVGGHLGAEGDDHQRDGGFRRRSPAVHVPLPQDWTTRRQAHVGRTGAHRRYAWLHRRRVDDRAARRLLHTGRQMGRRERRRRTRHRRRELAERCDCRTRSTARTRDRGSDDAAEDESGRSDEGRAAAANLGSEERRGRGKIIG